MTADEPNNAREIEHREQAMAGPQLLFALHDVTPFHLARIQRAEALFAEWGVQRVTYLLVPNYHAAYPAQRSSPFGDWLASRRPFAVEWCLHGFFHLRSDESVDARSPCEAPINADEGEFRQLGEPALGQRLERGREIYRECLGLEPRGFIAPKWQYSAALPQALARRDFAWTEDDRRIHHFSSGRHIAAPVITWATRTRVRKTVSRLGCPLLFRWWRRTPLLRIAVHPFDFDHEETIDSMRRVIVPAAAEREQLFYDERLFGAAT